MKTKIEWTGTMLPDGNIMGGFTFNPWWGCVKVSEGCKFCYAEAWDKRWNGEHWGPNTTRRTFADKHWNEPLKWNKLAGHLGVRLKVFCASMADWAEDNPSIVGERARLFQLIKATPNLNWLLLTKRCDEKLLGKLPDDWGQGYDNVWLGTSCENQKAANDRIPYLLQIPAVVHFISGEPLLGPIDFENIEVNSRQLGFDFEGAEDHVQKFNSLSPESSDFPFALNWVIVGGESGDNARPMHPDWAASIMYQCSKYEDVHFFFKQWGEWQHGSNVVDDNHSGKHIVLLSDGNSCDYLDNEVYEAFIKSYKPDIWNSLMPNVMAKVGKHKSGKKLSFDKEFIEMPTIYDKINL